MLSLLRESALLLLFVVAALGYVVGRVRVRAVSLGVAAVLFVGLAFGAIDHNLKLPEFVHEFGLVVFVYTIGVASGPGFFAAFRRRGLRDNGLAFGVLVVGSILAAVLHTVFQFRPGVSVGIFTGSLTNTPALASVLEYLRRQGASEAALADPVVGYSVAYPLGVLGVLAAMFVARRFRVDDAPPESTAAQSTIENLTVRVTQEAITHGAAYDILQAAHVRVVFGRLKREGKVILAPEDIQLCLGDLISVVGGSKHVQAAAKMIGEISAEHLELDRSILDFRRVFVSNPAVAGRPLHDIALAKLFGAVVTRVRRGDMELIPDHETVIELGDRVRVVAPRAKMNEVSKFLGDSYSAVSEIDVVTFSLGIALGLLVGSIPIPMFVGPPFRLGIAGGPLVVGLVLGRLERTGSMIWSLPYSASVTLRQMGLVLFLAGVGTRSGYAFINTLRQGGGVTILLAGALITFTVSLLTVIIGRKLLRIPLGTLSGMLAGIHTQPAVLAFANENHKDGTPVVGYATVFPLATIVKIILAQVLIMLLHSR
jgi:putative transport protein